MNRRTLLTAFLPGIIGFALPALASPKFQTNF